MDIYNFFEKKKMIVQNIYDNTKKQSESINSMDDDETLKLIDKRGIMINDFMALDIQIKSLGKLPESLKLVNEEIIKQVKLINDLDEYNKKCIKKMQESIDAKFNFMNKTKRAITNGYYKTMDQQNGFFVDRKS